MKTVAQTVIEADRFYTIAARTGSVIEAAASTKNEETVRLGKYDHKPEQEWAFIRVGDGVYRIRNRASGKLLDLTMTGTANGTWLHLWEDVGGTSQMWTVEPTPAGTVRLRSSWASGKCIDTVGIGVSDGAQLQIWQETAGEDQLWTISEVKDRASAKRAAKKDEPAAAPVEEKVEVKAEEKTAEAAPVVEAPKAEEVKAEPVKTEEKPAEAAPAVEAPKAEEVKAEPAKAEAKPAEKAAPAAVKAPVKKPSRKTSRAARKKAAAKK